MPLLLLLLLLLLLATQLQQRGFMHGNGLMVRTLF